MMQLNLTADERAALTKLVQDTIAADPYPLSPRIRRLKALLAKLDPSVATQAIAEPLPPPKAWVNSSSGSGALLPTHDQGWKSSVLRTGSDFTST